MAPAGEYDGIICAATATQAVATITIAKNPTYRVVQKTPPQFSIHHTDENIVKISLKCSKSFWE